MRETVKNYTLLSELAKEYAMLHPKYRDEFPGTVRYDYLWEEFIVEFVHAWGNNYSMRVPLYYLNMNPDEVKEEFKRRERVKNENKKDTKNC